MHFELQENLTLPVNGKDVHEGLLVYPKSVFGIGYKIIEQNPFTETFRMNATLLHLPDYRELRTVGPVLCISKDGRPSDELMNEKDFKDYVAKKTQLDAEQKTALTNFATNKEAILAMVEAINANKKLLYQLVQNLDKGEEDTEEITSLRASILESEGERLKKNQENNTFRERLTEVEKELELLIEVQPEYKIIDRYSDVIGNYIVNGQITPAGFEWIGEFEMNGVKLKNIIELPSAPA